MVPNGSVCSGRSSSPGPDTHATSGFAEIQPASRPSERWPAATSSRWDTHVSHNRDHPVPLIGR
jgi:hypothetical protein